MSKKKYHTKLAQTIADNSFTGATIYSLMRLGKTSYAMQVMYELYGNWDDVFRNMFFRLEDITDYLFQHIHTEETLPCILWDDAGVHANKMLYFSNANTADLLKRLFDVIGIATKGILLTTPVPGDLLKSLRNYEFMQVKIMKGKGEYDRIARIYQNKLFPSGMRRNPTAFEDHYDVRLPQSIYERYTPIREQYYIESLQALRDHIQEKKLEACMKQTETKRLEEALERYT